MSRYNYMALIYTLTWSCVYPEVIQFNTVVGHLMLMLTVVLAGKDVVELFLEVSR